MDFEILIYNNVLRKELDYKIFAMHYLAHIPLFYTFNYFVLQFFSKKRGVNNLLIFTDLTILLLLSYTFANHVISYVCEQLWGRHGSSGINVFWGTVYRGIWFMVCSTGFHYAENYLKEKRQSHDLEMELLEAENSRVKGQVNPHFQNSTLMFIQNRCMVEPDIAGDLISHYAKLVHYGLSIDNTQDKVVPLVMELEMVSEMIALFAAQITSPHVILATPENVDNLFVMPRLIVCLAENMYKHGDLTKAEYPGLIRVEHHSTTLKITTKNLISTNRRDDGFNSGMENLKKRLVYTYGDEASIETWSDGRFFEVRVFIKS